MVSVKSTTKLPSFHRSQPLGGQCVGEVYDDTVSLQKTTMLTHVFHKYIREKENFCDTVFACSYGNQVEILKKKDRTSRGTVLLMRVVFDIYFCLI